MAPRPVLDQQPPAVTPVARPQAIFEDSGQPQSKARYHPHVLPSPLVRLHLDDLSHEATRAFLSAVEVPRLLTDAIATVLKWLYDVHETPVSEQPSSFTVSGEPAPWPSVRSVTLVLRPMGGVAYTTSLRIDEEHKEIHISLEYLAQAARSDRLGDEITGVAVHEMVHVWQSYAEGSAPGGLVEGIADWVRLRAGLAPPHWERQAGDDGRAWDDGYETTAWFLDWLESVRVGPGTVRQCNAKLQTEPYDESTFWQAICHAEVDELWNEYGEWLKNEGSA